MIKRLQFFIGNPRYLSVGLVFAFLSILTSFWATRLPFLKDKIGMTDGDLGIALFFIPLGAVTAMLLTNKLITLIGEGRVTIISTGFLTFAFLFPFLAVDFIQFSASLFFAGIILGLVDVSMNTMAGYFEHEDKVTIMSTCHGFFSLGGMIGAGIGSILIGLTFDPLLQMIISGTVVFLILILFLAPKLFFIKSSQQSSSDATFALPKGPLIPLAVISFCAFISEGAIMDWSTIYMQDFLLSDPYVVGFGFAGFSLFMTLGRFNGDYAISKLGENKVMLYGLIMTVSGNILVLTATTTTAIIGFSMMGMGFSTLVPIAFSAAARTEQYTSSYGIAAVASAGYVGFLLGPVLIGLIADQYNLNVSFFFVLLLSGLTLFGILKSRRLFN